MLWDICKLCWVANPSHRQTIVAVQEQLRTVQASFQSAMLPAIAQNMHGCQKMKQIISIGSRFAIQILEVNDKQLSTKPGPLPEHNGRGHHSQDRLLSLDKLNQMDQREVTGGASVAAMPKVGATKESNQLTVSTRGPGERIDVSDTASAVTSMPNHMRWREAVTKATRLKEIVKERNCQPAISIEVSEREKRRIKDALEYLLIIVKDIERVLPAFIFFYKDIGRAKHLANIVSATLFRGS